MKLKPISTILKPHHLITILAIAALATNASAALITWTLTDVLFSDGGTASGEFTYDATTGIYSNFNVQTTAGAYTSGSTYNGTTSTVFSSFEFQYYTTLNISPGTAMDMYYTDALTDAGGTTTLFYFDETVDAFATYRHASTGTLVGVSAVPIPAAGWLFGSGLVGLIGVARKKARA